MDAPINLTISGLPAEMSRSKFYAGWDLLVDGVTQSNVDVADPSSLNIPYVRYLGDMIDSLLPGDEPISVLHLGAGAMTLARYIEHKKPGSSQTVIELEKEIVDLVSNVAPLAIDVEIIYGDAREVLQELPTDVYDLVISDLYLGINTPKHVATLEFYKELSAVLKEDGVLLCNVTDESLGGSGPIYDQFATITEALGSAVVVTPSNYHKSINAPIAGARTSERLMDLTIPEGRGANSVIREMAGNIIRDADVK